MNTSGDMPTKITRPGGTEVWYLRGVRHREDGPAVVRLDGTKEWLLDGKRHRKDGPAVTRADGTEEWWLHGMLHREDGPAVVYRDGTRQWWLHGKPHREDGPAVVYADGAQVWWLHGQLVTQPMVGQIAAATHAIDRVRALHQRHPGRPDYCGECVTHTQPARHAPWPCATIQAIDPEQMKEDQ